MGGISRRGFLAGAASAAFAPAVPKALSAADGSSVVIDVRSAGWLGESNGVDRAVVSRMVAEGIMAVTSKSTPEAAWRSLFSPSEVVGLKFNRISRDFTGANQALVDAIAEGLLSAGLKKGNIIVAEAHAVRWDGGQIRGGWAETADFGSGKTRLSNFLVNQVDALINVANLKHHPIAGFTGALKNLSHANDTIMEGPQRFHGNACDPYIADICALDRIRGKARLHLVNGLKGIFDRGAYPPAPQFQWRHDGLLFSFDPVALDAVGAVMVDRARADGTGRPLRRDPRALRYLETAAERDLGVNELTGIEVRARRA